jgi:GT2 family glycosyltransferase
MVSVVMPTFNRAHLLPQTIRAILGQSYEDIELIVVDDASTDETPDVIDDISDRRLHYVRLADNRGVGAARHIGLQNTSGKYIALADSDDLWMPDKLAQQVDAMEEHRSIDVLFTDFIDIHHTDGTRQRGFVDTQQGMDCLATRHLGGNLWDVEDGIEMALLKKSGFIATPTVMLRNRALEKIGSFNASLRMAEDFEFWLRASVLGAGFAYIDEPLVERHLHISSLTTRKIATNLELLKALDTCEQTCLAAGRHDLLDHLKTTEKRKHRTLLWLYGRTGQRSGALRAFVRSLRYGLSLRTSFALVLALLGPRAVDAFLKFQQHQKLDGLKSLPFCGLLMSLIYYMTGPTRFGAL